jgi:hypothetical protein
MPIVASRMVSTAETRSATLTLRQWRRSARAASAWVVHWYAFTR